MSDFSYGVLLSDLVDEAMSAFGHDASSAGLAATPEMLKRIGLRLSDKLLNPPISDKLDELLPDPTPEKLNELMYLAHLAGHQIYRELYAN